MMLPEQPPRPRTVGNITRIETEFATRPIEGTGLSTGHCGSIEVETHVGAVLH